jgi:hypothetical protein
LGAVNRGSSRLPGMNMLSNLLYAVQPL